MPKEIKVGFYKKRQIFPIVDGIDYSKLKLTDVALYSVSYADQSILTVSIIKEALGTTSLTVTDATANVGGDTIQFGLNFDKVNAVELDRKHYEMLKHNIGVYGLKNVETYHGDFLKLKDKLKQDVIYFDPPWGGPDYKKKKKLHLYLGGKDIANIIGGLIKKIKAKLYVLKAPYNFDINHLTKMVKNKIEIFDIGHPKRPGKILFKILLIYGEYSF